MSPSPLEFEILAASDEAFLVRLPAADAERVAGGGGGGAGVLAVFELLRREPVPGQLDLHPAYASLLVRFDARGTDPREVEAALRDRVPRAASLPPVAGRTVEIPVRYGGEDGPDLADVARLTGLDEAGVIAAHAEPLYTVAFLGFSPGFPYLSGLPARLAVPRLAAPRTRVPAGSVAIGGAQTGIYPAETAGGWRLIGRTPLALLAGDADGSADEPTLLRPGDRVRFVAQRG